MQHAYFFHSVHQNFDCNKYGSSDSFICVLEYLEEFFNLEFNEIKKS